MKKNRLVSGSIRPQSGELLSSWVNRGLQAGDPKLTFLAARFFDERITDPDISDRERVFRLISQVYAYPAYLTRLLTPNINHWISPRAGRKHFCPACISDDIMAGRYPSWRIQWIYNWSVICMKHLRPLISIDSAEGGIANSVTKAVKHLTSSGLVAQCPLDADHICIGSALLPGHFLVAYYFQRWLFGSINHRELVLPSGLSVSHRDFFNMVELFGLSALRVASDHDITVSVAYSHLSRLAWPSIGDTNVEGDAQLAKHISMHASAIKAGFFSYLGILLRIPNCCQTARSLIDSGKIYVPLHTSSLVPGSDRCIQELLIAILNEDKNSLASMLQSWFNLDLSAHLYDSK